MSNTFATPKAVSSLALARIDQNQSFTSLLTNFASTGAPNPFQISLEGSLGLQTGMLWYKSGSDSAQGQGRLLIYDGSGFTRNGISTYRMPTITTANTAVINGQLSYGELVLLGNDILYLVNSSNTGVVPVTAGTAQNSELFDGLSSSQFLRSDVADTITAKLTVSSNLSVSQNIGIGISNPSTALAIHKDSVIVELNDTNGTIGGSIQSYFSFRASDLEQGSIGFNTSRGDMSIRNSRGNLYIQTDTYQAHTNSRIFFQVDGSTVAVMNQNLFFGIGTSTPTAKLSVLNSSNDIAARITQQGSGHALQVESSTSDSTPFVITSNGFVGIGKSSPAYPLDINGGLYADGDITTSSDARLKNNVIALTNAIETVKQLQGVSFTKRESGKNSIGLIAQQVEEILPDLVYSNGVYKGIAYQNIVALLIEAIKEQQVQIERLQSER